MKFKQFLTETSEAQDRALNEIIKNVDERYLKRFLNNADGNKIYRGRGDHGHVAIHTPPKKRKSANTTNEFTLTVDNLLTSWKEFPKRSESFICATSADIAENYGYVYRVLPFGNPDIGVCPSEDMWNSFDNIEKFGHEGNGEVQGYNSALEQINFELFGNEDQNFDTVSDLKSFFKKIDLLIKNDQEKIDNIIKSFIQGKPPKFGTHGPSSDPDDDPYYKPPYKDGTGELAGQMLILAKKENGIINAINKLLDPKINAFQIMKPNELFDAGVKYDEREVWLSCKCAFILESSVSYIQGRMKFLMGK